MLNFRIDRKENISSIVKTDEGYLQITAPVARTGVYRYLLADGSIQREYIPPQTLKNSDSINSLKLKPVTNNHPQNFVNTDSFKDLAVGTVGETIEYEDGKLFAKFIVSSQDGIDSINEGRKQLSPSYSCDVELKSGVSPDGEHYDAIQTNRKYNHLALVDKARGGDELTFKLDNDEKVIIQIEDEPFKGDAIMASVRIDGVDHTIENEAVVSHISKLTTKVDSLEKDLTAKSEDMVKLDAKCDALTEDKKVLQSKLDGIDIDSQVASKLELINTANSVLGEDGVKVSDSAESIMEAVILKVAPTAKEKIDAYEDKADKAMYLKARFDAIIEQKADEDVAKGRKDGADGKSSSVDSAKAKRLDSLQNAWKGK